MSQYKFSNYKQLFGYMDKRIEVALSKTADLAMERLTQNVLDSVYDWQPERYERTYQLLEAISRTKVKKVYGRYVCEIFFDYTKMQPIIRDSGWNSHASFFGNWISNEQSSSDLVNFLEHGTNNPYFNHPSHGFIKETVSWLEKEYNKIFIAYF